MNGESAALQKHRLAFHGNAGTLFGIRTVNLLLTMVTLGVYSFWGKTRIRSYMLSQTEFEGDRFAYHGTGKELFKGWTKAFCVFILPLALLTGIVYVISGNNEEIANAVVSVAGGIATLFVYPLILVGSLRYRLSRTSWRGIRFSFRGQVRDLVKIFVKGSLLSMITLGLYYPYFQTQMYAFKVSNAYFGSKKFEFDGDGRDLFKPFLLSLLLFFPTFGMYGFWYEAKKQAYFSSRTSFSTAKFSSTMTGWDLAKHVSGSVLILIFTLGMGLPWIIMRKMRLLSNHASLDGELALTDIVQDAQKVSAFSEGFESIVDIDGGLDL